MKTLGMTVNFERDKVYISHTKEYFELKRNSNGHLTLPLTMAPMKEETHEILQMDSCDEKEKKNKIKKVHHIFGHPKEKTLKTLYRNSSQDDDQTMKLVKEFSRECSVCLLHKRTPSRPKVGLPLANTFNQCVTLDLSERKKNKTYILYMIDSFSRLTRAKLIYNKEPNTIVKAIIDTWILGNGIGPGIPDRFQFDNGTEFNNSEVIELAEKHGLTL